VVNTAGLVTPGKIDPANIVSEAGTLTVTGNYTQGPAGSLLIKLDSTHQELQHDVIDVGGVFTADGSIDFSVINGSSVIHLASLLDQTFAPISFNTFAGRFSDTSIPPALNFTLGEGGVITITSDVPLQDVVSNQLEDLLSNENLEFTEIVEAMRFLDQQVEIVIVSSGEEEDDDDEKRAPRLVCK